MLFRNGLKQCQYLLGTIPPCEQQARNVVIKDKYSEEETNVVEEKTRTKRNCGTAKSATAIFYFIYMVSWTISRVICKAGGFHCATKPRALLQAVRVAVLHPRGAVGLGTPKEEETPTVPASDPSRSPGVARRGMRGRAVPWGRRSAPSSTLSGAGRRRLPKRRATRMRGVAAGPGDGGGGGGCGGGRRGHSRGGGRGRHGRAGPWRSRGGAAAATGAAAGAAGRRGVRLPGQFPGAGGRGQAPLPQALPAPGAGGAARPAAHGAGGAIPAALPAGRWALLGRAPLCRG